jgi:assimilatory nitrate reductase catalytic subunit
MATLLSGHRDLANPAHRAEVAALWGVDAVPANPGLTAIELFDALAAGEVKMVWIACTNPAQSLPNQAQVRAGLARAELVVLQEACADTETADYADVLLPASTWGEKDGTLTNSSAAFRASGLRCRHPAKRAPIGKSRSILRGGSRRGCSLGTSRMDTLFFHTRQQRDFCRARGDNAWP